MDYLPRTIDRALADWYAAAHRKPLVVRGARQTGKSTSVRHFAGRSAPCFLELNLERFEDLRLVKEARSADELLLALRSRENVVAFPRDSVLFIDEIQESPRVISWLRFLHEEHHELAVVVAGSLLEVRLRASGFPFPVGRVSFQRMGPLSFFEFLRARKKSVLADLLDDSVRQLTALPAPVHAQAMDQLHDYIVVGGMPEAVSRYLASGSTVAAVEVHQELRQALAEDIQKYPSDTDCMEEAFANLRHHYGLRFKYSQFVPGRRTVEMQDVLRNLEAAMVIHRVLPSDSLSLPICEKARAAPKLLPLDVGMALSDYGLPHRELNRLPFEDLLSGRFAECFVGQQLLAGPMATDGRLYFWVRQDPRRSAELDFLLPGGDGPLPVEVKSGSSGTLRSLHQFLKRSGRPMGVRLYSGPLKDEDQQTTIDGSSLRYRLLSLPLYLAGALHSLQTG